MKPNLQNLSDFHLTILAINIAKRKNLPKEQVISVLKDMRTKQREIAAMPDLF